MGQARVRRRKLRTCWDAAARHESPAMGGRQLLRLSHGAGVQAQRPGTANPARACPVPAHAASQKAAALDPHDVASSGGAAGEAARSKRYDSCYQHVMAVLRFLVDPAAGAGIWGHLRESAQPCLGRVCCASCFVSGGR